MKNIIFIFILFLFFSQKKTQIKMSSSEVISFKNAMKKHHTGLKSLSADFSQTKKIDFIEKEITHIGNLLFLNPEKLKITYQSPENQVIILKNHTLHIKQNNKITQFTNQAITQMTQILNDAFSGKITNHKDFNTFFYKIHNENLIKISPKKESQIKEIQIHFKKNHYTPSEIKIITPTNEHTHFKIKNQKINPAISEKNFNF